MIGYKLCILKTLTSLVVVYLCELDQFKNYFIYLFIISFEINMDSEQKTPNVETLRQMPYTELKRLARQRGIKGNLKVS